MGGTNEEMKEAKTIIRMRGGGELDIQRRGRPRSASVLSKGGRGKFFLYGSVCYGQIGGSFFFLVLVLLVSCIIVRLPTDSFDLLGRGKEEEAGVGKVLIYGRFYILFLYRSVVGKRRYHGAMGCGAGGLDESRLKVGVMDRTDTTTSTLKVPWCLVTWI